MKALRWTLFCLLTFGAGTAAAFVVHPPTVGIPSASADALSDDLSAVRRYAAAGRCTAVRDRLTSAASTIDRLTPDEASTETVDELNRSLARVRTQASAACQRAVDERLRREQEEREQAEPSTPTTPVATPEPEPTVEPTSPDPGGGVDPGTGTSPDGGAPTGPSGGVDLPDAEELRGRADEARRQIEERVREARREWGLQ